MTAIQRHDSTKPAPRNVNSVKVDLSSLSALTAAFVGHDAIVSAVSSPTLARERIWMDAAVAAGVKRIVPSEFSTNLENALAQKLPIVTDKLAIRQYVVEKLCVQHGSESGNGDESGEGRKGLEWTTINNGPFLRKDLWLDGFLGVDAPNKRVTYYDGGHRAVCTSTLERIAEAVAKCLTPEHWAETCNQAVYVYSTVLSQRQATHLLAQAMDLNSVGGSSGGDNGDGDADADADGDDGRLFDSTEVSIDTVIQDAYDGMAKGDKSAMWKLYVPFCYGDGYGGDFRDMAWNKRLGLPSLTDGEVIEMFRQWLQS